MMDNRVPYDKSTVIWSPDGELVQLSYARRASEKGLSAMGIILDDDSILLAGKRKLDVLIETQSKIKLIDDNLYILASGLSSDSNLLVSQARVIAQRHYLIYGEQMGPEALARSMGDMMARVTLSGGLRAFGTSLIIAGFHPDQKKPKIFFVDNGGSFFSAKAYASGQDTERIVAYFREHYKTPLTLEEGKKLVIDALNSITSDPSKKITEKDVEFLVIRKDQESKEV